MDFTLVCDAMLDLEGAIRPAIYLAEALVEKGYKTSMVSPIISGSIERQLRTLKIEPINLHSTIFAQRFGLSMLWFELWGREALFRLNSRCISTGSGATINFSHTIALPSIFCYLQGPMSSGLKDMRYELKGKYKFAYEILRPALEYADKKLCQEMCNESNFVLANSRFCASLYQLWGINVTDVLYPPIDGKIFQPQSSTPSGDYVLTYFGKESKFSIIKSIVDLGVRVKAFGSKALFIPKELLAHPNIEFLGRVSAKKLAELYSNALFTIFPFTSEPFGYIPVESMACGTPTLTYSIQGPGESVVNEVTGWLVKNDRDLIKKANELWRQGYPSEMRFECAKNASIFERAQYIKKWFKLIESNENFWKKNI